MTLRLWKLDLHNWKPNSISIAKQICSNETYPDLKTKKQLESFYGLASHFRKFIPDFSVIAKPLSDMNKENVKFEMDPAQVNSFNALKKILSEKSSSQYLQLTVRDRTAYRRVDRRLWRCIDAKITRRWSISSYSLHE